MRSAAICPLLIRPARAQLAAFGQERSVPLWIDQAFVLVERVLAQRQLSRFNELLHLLSADSQLAHGFLHAHSLALFAQRRDILTAYSECFRSKGRK